MTDSTFHLGDRVRIVHSRDLFNGRTGTVLFVHTPIDGKMLVRVKGERGDWDAYFRPDELEKEP